MSALARFRVDPAMVRVSVRTLGGVWRATVALRGGGHAVCRERVSPVDAVDAALDAADSSEMPGIDLGMECSYEHPFGVEQ